MRAPRPNSLSPHAGHDQRPRLEGVQPGALARLEVVDGRHLVHGEHESRGVADQEDEDDAHEDDGQVVLLLPPGLLGGRGRVPAHAHLPAVAVLHVLVDLEKRTNWGGGVGFAVCGDFICLKMYFPEEAFARTVLRRK